MALGLQLKGACSLKATALSSLQHMFPYISAMVNNGSLTYDHSKDGRWTELRGAPLTFGTRTMTLSWQFGTPEVA